MAFTLKKVKIYSRKDKKIVDWDVAVEKEKDEDKGQEVQEHEVIIARYKDEVHRFSPNSTDDEIYRMVSQINQDL